MKLLIWCKLSLIRMSDVSISYKCELLTSNFFLWFSLFVCDSYIKGKFIFQNSKLFIHKILIVMLKKSSFICIVFFERGFVAPLNLYCCSQTGFAVRCLKGGGGVNPPTDAIQQQHRTWPVIENVCRDELDPSKSGSCVISSSLFWFTHQSSWGEKFIYKNVSCCLPCFMNS